MSQSKIENRKWWGAKIKRRLSFLLSLLTLPLALASCRIYEPEHYPRLNFAPNQKSIRVLMIGDSLTYYNDLPGILQQLSSTEPAPIYVEKVTFPFRSLAGHWNAGEAVKRIRNGRFDYVILQDFSNKPATDPGDCLKYFTLFDHEIKNANGGGGQTIIFQNWTRLGHDADYPIMQNTYSTIHDQIFAPIAPVGDAWKRCSQFRPDIKLLLDDRHPTEAGSYLAACVLYDTLYHKPSANLPLTLLAPKLPPTELDSLRTVADQTTLSR